MLSHWTAPLIWLIICFNNSVMKRFTCFQSLEQSLSRGIQKEHTAWRTRFGLTDKIAPYGDSGLLKARSYYSWDDIASSSSKTQECIFPLNYVFLSTPGAICGRVSVRTACTCQTYVPVSGCWDINLTVIAFAVEEYRYCGTKTVLLYTEDIFRTSHSCPISFHLSVGEITPGNEK